MEEVLHYYSIFAWLTSGMNWAMNAEILHQFRAILKCLFLFRKSGYLSVRIPTSTKFKSSLILRWWESLQSRMPLFLKMFLFLHWWDDQFWYVEIWTPPVWCLFSFLIRWRLNRVCDEFHYIFSGDEHFGFLSSI